MHRSYRFMSSHDSGGAIQRAMNCCDLRCASSVIGGSLPLGGSMMSEVWVMRAPRSTQNSL